PVDVLGDPVGEGVEVLVVGDVQFENRRGFGQPLSDPLHEREPTVSREDHGGPLLLAQPCHVEGGGGGGQDAGDQDAFAFENSRALSRSWTGGWCGQSQWPMPRPPSTGMTAPVM